ncbi:MAG: efflux RND transporter periplasmic adaptor subunit [Clostridia bacterium]
MRKKRKFMIIIFIILTILVISVVRVVTASQDKYTEVDIGTVESKIILQTILVAGNIEANNKEEIALPTEQKILEIYSEEGQEVKEGDAILKIDTTDFEHQLKKLVLDLKLAEVNLESLINSKSKLDKKTLESSVKTAEINLYISQEEYDDANRKYNQQKVLYEIGAVSKEEYEAARKMLNDSDNQLELSIIKLENAKDSLSNFSINNGEQIISQQNQVERLEVDISSTKDKLDKSVVKSSITGRVVQLDVKKNQYPTMENNIVKIYDLSQYKVKLEVSQYDSVNISNGQNAVIRVKGIDSEYKGTVTSIGEAAIRSNEGLNKEAKVEVEVTLDNPDNRIKVGFEADIEITLKESPKSLAVSFESILDEKDGRKYLYVVEENKAVKRFIKAGIETDFEIQILEGLKAGEQYIKNPTAALKDGHSVRQSGGN